MVVDGGDGWWAVMVLVNDHHYLWDLEVVRLGLSMTITTYAITKGNIKSPDYISPRNGEEKEIDTLGELEKRDVLALKDDDLGNGNGLVTIITVS